MENVNYIIKKANKRIFFLRRLKKLGASVSNLREVYILFIRPILEFCAPLWAGALTLNRSSFLSNALERIQQNCLKIISPSQTYFSCLESLRVQSLSDRRTILTKKHAEKMSKNERYSYLFQKCKPNQTRSKRVFLEPRWKTNRYGFSSIPHFIRILNGEEK